MDNATIDFSNLRKVVDENVRKTFPVKGRTHEESKKLEDLAVIAAHAALIAIEAYHKALLSTGLLTQPDQAD